MLRHDLRLPQGGFFHREVVSRWKSEKSDALRCRHASRMLRELGIIAWQSAGRKPEVRSFKRHRASARLASPPKRHFHRTRGIRLESIVFDAVVTIDRGTTRRTHLAGDLGAPHTSWYREIPRMVTDHSRIAGALLLRGIDGPTRAIAPLLRDFEIK